MQAIRTPNSRCRAAAARCDITPPVGIYHRMWGAALHDKATGVHRPLEATLVWLAPSDQDSGPPCVIISLDHCVLETSAFQAIRDAVAEATGISAANVLVTLSHTHGSGWMSRSRSHLPGGELIGPYLDELAVKVARSAVEAQKKVRPATIVYGSGRCDLAAHRDGLDPDLGRFVCGFHPEGKADDTLLIGRVTDDAGETLATIVNYACHPTTLAWDNTLISPDWVGAMKETIEKTAGGLCLFLQGASGDLGPREGFVGDTEVADRNGRKVAFEALATLATLPPPGTEFRYAGPVVSGTVIGTWRHESLPKDAIAAHSVWRWEENLVELPYRHDLPSLDTTKFEREHWLAEEAKAREARDEPRMRDCRAEAEQRTRQITRLEALIPGLTCPLTIRLGQIGDALWVFVPGELYQVFQTTLRERFATRPVIVTTLTGDWQPGYIPSASTYGYGIYQEVIAATAAGCLETLIEAVSRHITTLTSGKA
jgi:hypothetical protein